MNRKYSKLTDRPPRSLSSFIFYIALCLALFAIDVRLGYLKDLRAEVKNTLLPLQLLLLQTQQAFSDQTSSFFQTQSLEKQVLQLKNEQALLTQKYQAQLSLDAENQSLRSLLALSDRKAHQWLTAEIMARQYEGITQKVLLNKGASDGLRLGMPVQVPNGLFGQIATIYPNFAEVRQITQMGMSVPAKIRGTNIQGVVYGTGDGLVDFRHFLQRYTIKVGDELVTSGLDGLFLPDVPIAKVVRIEVASERSGVRVLAEPVVEFSQSRFVMISLVNQAYAEWVESLQDQMDKSKNKKAPPSFNPVSPSPSSQ